MPVEVLKSYLKCIDIIESHEALVGIETASFPSIKEASKRQEIFDRHKGKTNDLSFIKEEKILTSEELARTLGQWQMKK